MKPQVIPGEVPQILLYQTIGQDSWLDDTLCSDIEFMEVLTSLGAPSKINVRINSPGGDCKHAFAIYNALVRHDAEIVVDIDHLAASCASVIAMAGDSINIAANARLMIHKTWTYAMGNADDMQHVIGVLAAYDKTLVDTYEARTKQKRDQLETWLAEETWFTATEAKQFGFVDAITQELKNKPAANRGMKMLARFRHTPKDLSAVEAPQPAPPENDKERIERAIAVASRARLLTAQR